MRTALLIERFDTMRGGAEVYTSRLAEALLRTGHRVDVFCGQSNAKCTTADLQRTMNGRRSDRGAGIETEGLVVHELPAGGWTRAGRIRGFARACADAVREGRFDVAMGVGRTLGQDVLRPPGGMVRAAREGTLRSLTNPAEIIARRAGWMMGPSARVTEAIERKQFTSSGRTHFIINSKMVMKDVERYYSVDEKRLHLIYTGVDTKRFSPEARRGLRTSARAALGIAQGETAFLFVGHNFRLKGLEPLLEASAKLADTEKRAFRVLVAGGGKREAFAGRVRALGLAARVKFIGAEPEMLKLYAAADAVAHPTFYDPFSNVTLEAWACGLPAITSAYNGAAELMTGELARWVVEDPTDGTALSERMGELMDEGTRERAGKRFREAAEGHDMTEHCAEVARLFEQVRAEKEKA